MVVRLQAMKQRLGSKASTGVLYMERPFFNVDVELRVPHVAMSPPLELIQSAINACAKKVLATSKSLPCWGQLEVGVLPGCCWQNVVSEP